MKPNGHRDFFGTVLRVLPSLTNTAEWWYRNFHQSQWTTVCAQGYRHDLWVCSRVLEKPAFKLNRYQKIYEIPLRYIFKLPHADQNTASSGRKHCRKKHWSITMPKRECRWHACHVNLKIYMQPYIKSVTGTLERGTGVRKVSVESLCSRTHCQKHTLYFLLSLSAGLIAKIW